MFVFEKREISTPSEANMKQSLEVLSRSAFQRTPTCGVGNRSGQKLAFSSDSHFFLERGCGQVSYLGGCEVGSLCPQGGLLQAFVFILVGLTLQREEKLC